MSWNIKEMIRIQLEVCVQLHIVTYI